MQLRFNWMLIIYAFTFHQHHHHQSIAPSAQLNSAPWGFKSYVLFAILIANVKWWPIRLPHGLAWLEKWMQLKARSNHSQLAFETHLAACSPSFGSVQVELAIPSRTLKLEKKANENEIKNEMNENYNEINCEFQVWLNFCKVETDDIDEELSCVEI